MVKCGHPTCVTRACYGVDGSKKTEFCPRHAKDGMVNVRKLRCRHEDCTKRARFSVPVPGSIEKAEFCAEHARAGMIDAGSKTCLHESCGKWPSFGIHGSRVTVFCAQHAEAGMVDVRRKRCNEQGCTKQPSYGVRGSKKAEYCALHGKDGMINVCSKRCANRDCNKHPKFGVNGSTKAEFCCQHAKAGMVNVRRKGYICSSSSSVRVLARTGIIRYNTKLPTAGGVGRTSDGGSTAELRAANTAVAVEARANVSSERALDGAPKRDSSRKRDATKRGPGGGNAAGLAAAAAAPPAAATRTAAAAAAVAGSVVNISSREGATKLVRNLDYLNSREETDAAEPFMGLRKHRRRRLSGGSGGGGGYDGFSAQHSPAARPAPMGRDKVSKNEAWV
ncbi:unnamed protein product [Laminaria digitata]